MRIELLAGTGVKKNRLFITASQSLYSPYLEAQDVQVW